MAAHTFSSESSSSDSKASASSQLMIGREFFKANDDSGTEFIILLLIEVEDLLRVQLVVAVAGEHPRVFGMELVLLP